MLGEMGPLPEGSMLVTLDVTSLYTNIPNKEGVEAANELLTKCRSRHFKPSNESLIKLLELVLTRNNFQFNGKNYLQIGGTSMGTRAAPCFANCFLDKFERDFVYTYHLQPLLWKRYLDDCFCIWQHGEEELTRFLTHLNTRMNSIKFTMETSLKGVAFLDTWVSLENNQLKTDLFCKPTDSHSYLLYSSAHTRKCKDSIPYSQLLRIRRICSDITDFDKHAVKFGVYFQTRGYPNSLLENAIIKARRLDRTILLSKKTTTEIKEDINILVTQFHPDDNNLADIVKNNWDLLGKSQNTQFLYQSKPLIGYKRAPNLKDLLVKAEIRSQRELEHNKISNRATKSKVNLVFPPPPPFKLLKQSQISDFFKEGNIITNSISNSNLVTISKPNLSPSYTKISCNKNLCRNFKCKTCPFLDTNNTITSVVTKESFPAKTNISCHSSNLIYCIYCKICGLQYVGQTKRELSQRLQEHLLNIKHLYSLKNNPNYKFPRTFVPHSVGLHFSSEHHSGQKDLKIKVLDFIKVHPQSLKAKNLRLKIEKKWIHTLRTPAPQGMNMMD